MSDADRKERARLRRIETAKELEGRGHLDHAVKEFLRAGAPAEAARALAAVGRLADAGEAILKSLGVEGTDVAGLSAADRELVAQAAAFFGAAHQGGRAQGLKDALAAAPPPPPDAASRARASSSVPPAGRSSGSHARPSPASPAPAAPERPAPNAPNVSSGSFRPPVAGGSASFRPPAAPTVSSGSFRPPSASSGSFRPPSGASASFRPPSGVADSGSFRPPRASEPAAPVAPSEPARPPRASEATRAAIKPPEGEAPPTPTVTGPRAPSPAEKALGIDSGSFRAPKISPLEVPKERPARSTPSGPALSASGEAISDYSASRAAGWRDADEDALERSIQEHLAAGRKGAAARVARDAGQIGRALVWFTELGLHAQVGACLRQLGRPADALEELLKVDPASPGYRKACFEVIGIVTELGKLGFEVDRFLTRFVSEGPADPDEISTYMDLARLYSAAGFAGGAKRCLREVLELDPDHAEARALETELRRERRARQSPPPRVSGAPASARGLPPLTKLDELRELAKRHAPAS